MPKDSELLTEIEEEATRTRYLRYGHEREWYRNLLFKQGHQWIVWDETGRRFRHKKLKPWIPTPVTNKFASTLDALVALMLRVEPSLQWKADDQNNEQEKSLAETYSTILDRMKKQTHFNLWRQELASWLVYTGNAYVVNYYDPDGGMPIQIPYYKCDVCNKEGLPTDFEQGCPNCGGTSHNYSVDPVSGQVREEQFQGGQVRSEVATPFEIFFDFGVTQQYALDRILRMKERPLTYFHERFKKGKAVQAGSTSSSISEFYASTLAYLSTGPGLSPGISGAHKRPMATEKWYARMPCDDYPNGLIAIVGGDKLLEKSELYCRDHMGQHFLPVTQWTFDPVPGSGVGKTVASDLAVKQKQRNELESLIQLITMRMANPVWIVPYGTDVEGFSGQPGAILKAIQIAPNASGSPQRLPGENVPSSVMEWLKQIDVDMEDMSAIYDILKGNAPPGVTAGYALQLLLERGQSRWGPLFQRWENGHIGWAIQVCALVKEYMPAEQIKKLLGEHGQWELARFKDEHQPAINLTPEAGGTKPASALAEQASVDQLIDKGLIDVTDPANRSEILRSLGLSKYDKQSDWDMKDAAREEEAFMTIAESQDIHKMDPMQGAELMKGATRFRPQVDNHMVMLWSHKRFAKTDRFMALSAEWQAVWLGHLEEHAMRIMAETQMAMGPQATDSSSGKPGGGEGRPAVPGQPGASAPGGAPPELSASPKGGHVKNPVAMAQSGA